MYHFLHSVISTAFIDGRNLACLTASVSPGDGTMFGLNRHLLKGRKRGRGRRETRKERTRKG